MCGRREAGEMGDPVSASCFFMPIVGNAHEVSLQFPQILNHYSPSGNPASKPIPGSVVAGLGLTLGAAGVDTDRRARSNH